MNTSKYKNCHKSILSIIIGLLFVLSAQTAFSQTLELRNTQVEYEGTMYPAIEVRLEPGPDEVKDAWKDFIKDQYDVRMKGYGFLANKEVLYAEETEFPAISGNQMDFFTKVVEAENLTQLCVFASFGYDIHVSAEKYPREYAAMKDITVQFLQAFLPAYYEETITQSRERLEDLKAERQDMEEEIKENEEEINELTERNRELEKLLSENDAKMLEINNRLNNKEKMLENVKSRLKTLDRVQSDQ